MLICPMESGRFPHKDGFVVFVLLMYLGFGVVEVLDIEVMSSKNAKMPGW